MQQLEIRFEKRSHERLEELDRHLGAIMGVRQVDLWADRAVILIDRAAAVVEVASVVAVPVEDIIVRAVAEKPVVNSYRVAGMDCHSCEITLERRLSRLPGVRSAHASAKSGRVEVVGENGGPNRESVAAEIQAAGYSVLPADADLAGENRPRRPTWPVLLALLGGAAGVGWLMLSRFWPTLGAANGRIGFAAAVVIGLFAGFSTCMAVTGGLALSVASRPGSRKGRQSAAIWHFAAGRLVSYAGLGAAIGQLGRVLLPSPTVNGAIMTVAALVMLIMGLDALGLVPESLRNAWPGFLKTLGRRSVAAADRRGALAPFLLGAATFFLPCGFTQSLQIYALTVGSAWAGAAILGGFALGSLPAILALGLVAGSVRGSARRWAVWVAGALLVVLGAFNLRGGLVLLGVATRPYAGTASGAADLPVIVDGRQVIHMTVGGEQGAFTPDHFTVRAGLPVRWEIDQQASSGCLSFLVSSSLGLNEKLTLGRNAIDFTAPSPGDYAFSCSMGMYNGTITVVPRT